MIEVRKRKNENINSLIYRFNKRVQQSGILKEAKKRKYTTRPINKRKKRLAAIYRHQKAQALQKMAKLGFKV
jgi:ribosomal protein S21